MTPPAATVAGRATEPSRSRARISGGLAEPPRSPSRTTERTHRGPLRPSGPSPRTPRRVSGPSRGAVAVPGRVTSPARKPAPRRAPASLPPKPTPSVSAPLGERIAAYIRALPDHRWLDRLVRGRAWIPLLGVLLVGIVAIQVEVLKLGASIGRSMNLATQLQSRNQLLRSDVSKLSSDQRIVGAATKLGMYMPGPTEVRFVPAHDKGAVHKAIAGIRSPDAQTFLSALAALVSADGVTNPTLGSAGTAATSPSTAGTTVGTTDTSGTSQVSSAALGGTVTPTATTPTVSPTVTPTSASTDTAAAG